MTQISAKKLSLGNIFEAASQGRRIENPDNNSHLRIEFTNVNLTRAIGTHHLGVAFNRVFWDTVEFKGGGYLSKENGDPRGVYFDIRLGSVTEEERKTPQDQVICAVDDLGVQAHWALYGASALDNGQERVELTPLPATKSKIAGPF